MRRNLAARMGRWSASHWKTATFGWIAFVALAVVLGGAVGTKELTESDSPGESGRVAKILDDAFAQPAEENVLVQSRTLTAGDTRFQAAVEDVVARLEAVPAITNLSDPLEPANDTEISPDGRSALPPSSRTCSRRVRPRAEPAAPGPAAKAKRDTSPRRTNETA